MTTRELFPTGARVAFLHAHPDDETLATGVLVAGLIASGYRVAVVTATRGERGEIRPGVDVGADIVAHRERELAAALAALGVTEHCFLGTPPALTEGTIAPPGLSPGTRAVRYTDSGMRWVTPELAGPAADAGPDSLTAAGIDGPAADLVAFLRYFGPDVLVSYDALGGYGHPDHVACHHIAAAAATGSGVPLVEVVSDLLLPADDAVAWRAPEQLPAVRRALGCYASQLQVDGDEVVHVGGQRQPIAEVVWLRSARPARRGPDGPDPGQ
jgi:N-acetyl-1-D-myo-inositol-2-amino-2-deoxy-alpha-D-glucopyranoside deacetylase